MKKILVSLVVILGLVFGGGYFLAFTQSGNNILKPFINSYLKQKVKEADIKIESFTLKPSHLTANATINDMANVNLDGDFFVTNKNFDFVYTVKANKIETKDFKFDEKIYIKGKVLGNPKKAMTFGVGKVANSDIEYKVDIIDEKPQNLTAKIDKASLKKLLLLAGQKPYADAIVSLTANIPSLDQNNLQGKAHLTLNNGKIDSKLLKKDFQLELPKNTTFNLNSDASFEKESVLAKSTLKTSLASLTLPNTNYNIKKSILTTNYNLDVKNLAKLYSITKMKLKGDFKAHGNIKLKNKNLQASLITPSLGGETKVNLNGDKLNATLKGVLTNALFYKLNLPKYTNAKLNANVNLKSIKKLNGEFKLSASGVNKRALLKKMYDFDPGSDIKYTINSKGSLKDNKVYANTDIKNTLSDVKLKNTVFDINKGSLKTLYEIYIAKLSKLNYITKQKLKGDLKLTGDITKDKTLTVNGKSNKFGGTINFTLKGDNLTAKVKDAVLTKIQDTLSYPPMLEAKTFADLNYNLSSSKGKAVITMKEAKMVPNSLTKIMASLGGVDLAAQHYNDTKLTANLSKKLIDFDFKAVSKAVSLIINHGKIYQPAGKLDAKLIVKDKKREIPLKITGTTSNPKIKLDSSFAKDELKRKSKERLDKEKDKLKEKLENKLKDKLKIDADVAKDLFKKLF